jgi:hypothetical protein
MKDSSAPLAIREPEQIEPWRDHEWQRLWLSVQARPWTSLAICPAGSGVSADFSLMIAVTLARTGMMHLGAPIQVADGTGVQLSSAAPFAEEVRRYRSAGERILIALAPVSENPVTLSMAQTADACLLCVLLERMATAEAKDTVTKIGKERFLGSAVFHAEMLRPGG